MKNIYYFLILLLCVSCEDVIDVNLNTAPPKLVVDASIKWQKGTTGNEQKIKLTTTTGFYDTTIPIVSNAIVTVSNSSNTIFNFVETPNTGEYICTDFVPVINETYTLTIQSNGATYTASEKLLATPEITSIQQTIVQGFGGDEYQIKFFYQDNGLENNYYLIGFKYPETPYKEYGALSDEFFQGNEMFGFYTNEKLEQNDQLFMSLQGITLQYFNYMSKIISISGGNGGNPFATPPATVKGNIVNETDNKNYPLGYFNLSEIDTRNYTVQ
jgi:hypothetical protein